MFQSWPYIETKKDKWRIISFYISGRLKLYKWQEKILERMSDSRLAKQVYKYKSIGYGSPWDSWRTFKAGTGDTLSMPCCEDDNEKLNS